MDCEDCKNYVEYAGYQKLTPLCKECVDEGHQSNWKNIMSKFEPKYKQTNADRIRQMSDEELAEWIFEHTDCIACPQNKDCDDLCAEHWLEWLKKEVDDGKV